MTVTRRGTLTGTARRIVSLPVPTTDRLCRTTWEAGANYASAHECYLPDGHADEHECRCSHRPGDVVEVRNGG